LRVLGESFKFYRAVNTRALFNMTINPAQTPCASGIRRKPYALMQNLSRYIFRACCTLFCITAIASSAHAGEDYPLLLESQNPALQKALVSGLNDLSLSKAVAKQLLAVTVIDITDRDNTHNRI